MTSPFSIPGKPKGADPRLCLQCRERPPEEERVLCAECADRCQGCGTTREAARLAAPFAMLIVFHIEGGGWLCEPCGRKREESR